MAIAQSIYVEDASFFRVKNINLAYALPGSVLQRFKLKGVRVFTMLDNVPGILKGYCTRPRGCATKRVLIRQ